MRTFRARCGESDVQREARDCIARGTPALGVALARLAEGIDATTPAGKLQVHILGAIAEFKRERIRARVFEGLQSGQEPRPRALVPSDRLQRVDRPSADVAAERLGSRDRRSSAGAGKSDNPSPSRPHFRLESSAGAGRRFGVQQSDVSGTTRLSLLALLAASRRHGFQCLLRLRRPLMRASRCVDRVQVALDDDDGIFPAQILDHLLDASQPFVLVVPIDRHTRSLRLCLQLGHMAFVKRDADREEAQQLFTVTRASTSGYTLAPCPLVGVVRHNPHRSPGRPRSRPHSIPGRPSCYRRSRSVRAASTSPSSSSTRRWR
jgi:hypothetical protein